MDFKKFILLGILLCSVVPTEARLVIVFNENYNQEQTKLLSKILKVALSIEKVDSLPLYINEQSKIKDILPEDLVLYVIGTSYIHEGKILRDYFFNKERYDAVRQKTPHAVIVDIDFESPAPDFDEHITSENPQSGILLGQSKEQKIIIRLVARQKIIEGSLISYLPHSSWNQENLTKLSSIITQIIPTKIIATKKMEIQAASQAGSSSQEKQPIKAANLAKSSEKEKMTPYNLQETSFLKDQSQSPVRDAEPKAHTILRSIHLQLQDLARTTNLDPADKQIVDNLLGVFASQAGPSQPKKAEQPQLPAEPFRESTKEISYQIPTLAPAKDLPFTRANAKAQFQLDNYFQQRPHARAFELPIRETVKDKLFKIHQAGEKITQEEISQAINETDKQFQSLF